MRRLFAVLMLSILLSLAPEAHAQPEPDGYTRVASYGRGFIENAQWSADGREIHVTTATGVYVYNAATAELLRQQPLLATPPPPASFINSPNERYRWQLKDGVLRVREVASNTLHTHPVPVTFGFWARAVWHSTEPLIALYHTAQGDIQTLRVEATGIRLLQDIPSEYPNIHFPVETEDFRTNAHIEVVWRQSAYEVLRINTYTGWYLDASNGPAPAVSNYPARLEVFHPDSGVRLHSLDLGYTHTAAALAVSPDGSSLVINGRLYDIQTYRLINDGYSHKAGYNERVLWSPNSSTFVIVGLDTQVFHATDGSQVGDIIVHPPSINFPANAISHWSPDGTRLLLAHDYEVQVIAVDNDSLQPMPTVFHVGVERLLGFHNETNAILARNTRRDIEVYDSTTGHLRHTLPMGLYNGQGFYNIAAQPRGSLLAVAYNRIDFLPYDPTLRRQLPLWDLQSGRLTKTLEFKDNVQWADWSADGRFLFVLTDRVFRYDTADASLQAFSAPYFQQSCYWENLVPSPNGRYLLARRTCNYADGGEFQIYAVEDGTLLLEGALYSELAYESLRWSDVNEDVEAVTTSDDGIGLTYRTIMDMQARQQVNISRYRFGPNIKVGDIPGAWATVPWPPVYGEAQGNDTVRVISIAGQAVESTHYWRVNSWGATPLTRPDDFPGWEAFNLSRYQGWQRIASSDGYIVALTGGGYFELYRRED